jgi:RNA polymerase sigma-70 factor (ECF subfamily)
MGRPLDPWLCRVAVNLGIDWLRKNAQSNSQSTQLAEETAVPDPSPELLVTRAETRQRLLSIIDLLPRNQKRVLVLRDLHEFPVTEIAGLLNCRESTVRVHLARARHKMRSLIKIHASDLLR